MWHFNFVSKNKSAKAVGHLFTTAAVLFCLSEPLSAETVIPSEEKEIQDDFSQIAKTPGAVIFTPPEGWRVADAQALPASVKIMVVGKGAHEFPPSMNLGTENYTGTLKQYLKRIKEINYSQGLEWKDLGMIRTEAGDASLSQVDTKTQWGDVRMMHVILLKNETVYILTAASLKEEFPKFYKDFFKSLRSLKINEDFQDMAKIQQS
jgi:hypothetical protein